MGYSQVTRWCHTLLIELDNFSISSNPQVTILSIASFCRYWAIPSIIRDLLYKRCSSIIRGYNRISSDLGSTGYRSPGPPVVTAVYGVIRKRCQLAACTAADAAGSNCCLHPISYSAGSEKTVCIWTLPKGVRPKHETLANLPEPIYLFPFV